MDGPFAEGQSKHIDLPDVAPATFDLIRRYIYSGQANLSSESVVDVLVSARKLSLEPLLEAALAFVGASLDTDNVWSLLQMADIYDLRSLHDQCLRFIGTRANIVLDSDSALSISEQVPTCPAPPCPTRTIFCSHLIGYLRRIFDLHSYSLLLLGSPHGFDLWFSWLFLHACMHDA